MEVNNKVIREGILGVVNQKGEAQGGFYQQEYREAFDHLDKEITELVKSPRCSICARAIMKGIIDTPDFKERLEELYKQPVEGKIAYQTQYPLKEVDKMPESEWEAYFKALKLQQLKQTFIYHIAETNEVVFSYTGMKVEPTTVEF
jgi:hypothetical protein